MKRNKKRREEKGAAKWLVTYSDMVTLVLVFFILLFSMSQIDVTKFQTITQSFQSRAILDFLPSAVPSDSIDPNLDDGSGDGEGANGGDDDVDVDALLDGLEEWEKKADALARLMSGVEDYLEEHDLGDVITANRTEEGVVLVLQDSILFDSAEAEILDSGKPFLDEVGNLLKGIANIVRVEGHTDNRPISTYRYPSNWELSGARAGSVVRYFIEELELNEDRFLIAGYGETRPVVENSSPENWAQNRRVEIVILDSEHDQAQSQIEKIKEEQREKQNREQKDKQKEKPEEEE